MSGRRPSVDSIFFAITYAMIFGLIAAFLSVCGAPVPFPECAVLMAILGGILGFDHGRIRKEPN